MFYLTTHSTHFILWVLGVGYMVKVHPDSETENPLPLLYGLLFPISSNYFLICTIPRRITHSTGSNVFIVRDRSDDPSQHGATSRSSKLKRKIVLPSNNVVERCRLTKLLNGRKEMFYLTLIWRQTYGKEPLR